MKINFRKISAIAASALMTGMTLGVAAAASYPAPFVSGGEADVAIVYGSGAGVSMLDKSQAVSIQGSLGTSVDGGAVTVEGGEAFTLDKDSDHFNFNETLDGVYTSLDDEDMDFLADGTYKDGDVDETYTQTITPGTKALSLFADSDYNSKEPTLGFTWSNGQTILTYNIEFDDAIPFEDLVDTDMPLMGGSYYVLSVDLTTNNTITLLDSAEKVILKDGDSVTLGDKTVSIEFIDSDEVKFNVDGEITDKLMDHEYEELEDGSYIVANEVMYNAKEVGISSVEFSIGSGKIELLTGEDVEVNDEDVDGLQATFTKESTTGLTKISLAWQSDDETFLTAEDAITMPLFESVKLVFGGLNFPEEPEEITLDNGETMTLGMGNYDLPLFWFDSTVHVTGAGYLGDEDNNLVTATSTVANYTVGSVNVSTNTGGLDLVENNRILLINEDTDLTDIDTWYYEVTNIDWDGTDVEVELTDLIGDNDILFDSLNDVKERGAIAASINQVNATNAYLNFSASPGTLRYNRAVSEKGMLVTLPAKTRNQTNDFVGGATITFTEATKDDDVGQGLPLLVTVKNTSNGNLHASTYNATVSDEEESDDVMVGYFLSDLASKVNHDQTADEYDFDIEYFGEEVTADVQVVGGDATLSSGSDVLGNVVFLDTETSSYADKNVIVVGGSCINSAAAALVGGAKCGAAWTEATGVGVGQFLIKGYADSTITSKLALLVAGYEQDDTAKATTYLINKEVDTSKEYKGTTSTEIAVVVE